MSEQCKKCKWGIEQVASYRAMKAKQIPRMAYLSRARDYGSWCFACIHNGYKGKRAKIARRIAPNFQSLDLLEVKNEPNTDTESGKT